jgi:hypothetical protein
VTFKSHDVEADPARLADLERVHVPRPPATIVGDRVVHGWNPQALADLVGVVYAEPKSLSPAQLAERLDVVLAAAQRAMRQVPDEHLAMKGPGRDRTIRQLGYHVFRVAASFRDTREQGHLSDKWFGESPPAEMKDGAAIAAWGQTVRERLTEWIKRPGWCDGDVSTYYGPCSAHDLMERTTWHAAQHLRQLYWLLDRMGVEPVEPLTDDDLHGLPFPREVWS